MRPCHPLNLRVLILTSATLSLLSCATRPEQENLDPSKAAVPMAAAPTTGALSVVMPQIAPMKTFVFVRSVQCLKLGNPVSFCSEQLGIDPAIVRFLTFTKDVGGSIILNIPELGDIGICSSLIKGQIPAPGRPVSLVTPVGEVTLDLISEPECIPVPPCPPGVCSRP